VQEALPATPAPAQLAPGMAAQSAEVLAPGARVPALLPSRTEVLLTQLQESGRNNPEAWAGVLRNWLTEEEPT